MSPPRRDIYVAVTAELNPLRFFHAVGRARGQLFGTAVPDPAFRPDFGDERATDGSVNWLHPDDVDDDNGWLLDWVDEALLAVHAAVGTHLGDLLSTLDGAPGLFEVSLGVKSVQLTVDMSADDPGAVVRNLEQPFRQTFRNVETNDYRETAETYETHAGGTRMVHAFRAQGERYKAYNKTNRRFRLECELDQRALRRLGIQGTLRAHRPRVVETSFGEWFNRCAEAVLPQFNTLLAELHGDLPEQSTPLDLLYEVAHRVRRRAVGRELILCLLRDGRVPARLDYPAVSRLRDAGVLRRTARGLYAVGEQYEVALEVLRDDERSWFARFERGEDVRLSRTAEGSHLYRRRQRRPRGR